MNFTVINENFQCLNCKRQVPAHPRSCRNHCTNCLYSLHVDKKSPGDRASTCHALMKPIGILQSGKKGLMLLHECTKCGYRIKNKVAEDDNTELIIELSKVPVEG